MADKEINLQIPAVDLKPANGPQDEDFQKMILPLSGKLITAEDPLIVGKNFRTLDNMVYGDKSPYTIGGMTKINATYDLDTYLKIRNAYHFRKIQPAEAVTIENHILAQAYNSGGTGSTVVQNETAPPAAGEFTGSAGTTPATALWTDPTGTGYDNRGRFSDAPNGMVAYCNGVDTCIWGGNGIPCTSFITSTADVTDTPTNPRDYSDAMLNTRQDSENVAIIGGGNDTYAKVLLHFDTKDGADIEDTSSGGAGAHPGVLVGTADYSTDWAKFGTRSGKIAATADAFSIADHADLDFGAADGCIDFWRRGNSMITISGSYTYASGTGKITCVSGTAFTSFSVGDAVRAEGTSIDRVGHVISKDAGHTWIEVEGDFIDADAYVRVYVGSALCGRYADGTNYWYMALFPSYASFVWANGGATTFYGVAVKGSGIADAIIFAVQFSLGLANGMHIAIAQHYGVSLDLYVIGRKFTFGVAAIPDTAAALTFGSCQWAAAGTAPSYHSPDNVYYDEVRVSKGSAQFSGATISPPARAYALAANYWLVRSPLPIQGGKIYIPTGKENTVASTLTVSEWNGYSWIAKTVALGTLTDNTITAGVSLAKTGTFVIASTVTTSKTKHIEGSPGYWYLFNLSAGSAEIYYITLDAPFQQIVDIPDGIDRSIAAFFKYTTVYTDYTFNVREDSYDTTDATTHADLSSLGAFNSATGANCILLGFFERMQAFNIGVPSDGPNAVAGTYSIDAWDGSGFVEVGHVSDGTAEGGAPLAKPGTISFTIPDPWNVFKRTVANNSVPLYYYRLRSDGALTAGTAIYYVSGIPAPAQIRGYKFPLLSQDSLMLCCNMDGARNEVIIAAPETAQVFNGQNSARIPFGTDGELNCGCTIFSQYGSNLFNITMFFKDNEIWNLLRTSTGWQKYQIPGQVGCPASLTLDTVIIPPIEGQQQGNRSLAIWEAADGVYISEGRHPICVSDDIRDLWDQTATTHINQSYIKSHSGKVDKAKLRYHLFIATTTGSVTTLDDEWVLDLRKWKWSHVNRGTAKKLQGAVSVMDAYGVNHLYGYIDTGYLERLEYGNTFDGNDIVSTWQTGDFPLKENDLFQENEVKALVPVLKAKATTTANAMLTLFTDSQEEILTLDVAAGTPWVVGDTITGATSGMTCIITRIYSTLIFAIKNRTGAFTLGEILSNGTFAADQGTSYPTVTGPVDYTVDPTLANYRLTFPVKAANSVPGILHSLRMTITTNNETRGLEPYVVGIFFQPSREHSYV